MLSAHRAGVFSRVTQAAVHPDAALVILPSACIPLAACTQISMSRTPSLFPIPHTASHWPKVNRELPYCWSHMMRWKRYLYT